jgi:RTX calcium-binding nonapeptide repeat (4 copies)
VRIPVLAVLALLALAPAARGATVSVSGGELRVDAGPGEANRLIVSPADAANPAGPLAISDAGAPLSLTAGPGCAVDALTTAVTCPAAGVIGIDVEAGDGDDVVTVAAPGTVAVTVGGGAGADSITAVGGGEVRGFGEDGDDVMSFASPAPVRASGALGDDVLSITAPPSGASPGASVLTGGDGDDELLGGTGVDQLWGGAGADRIAGDEGADRLGGGAGADALDGAGGADRLAGGPGNDQLLGGDGNDLLRADAGRDAVDGGAGRDRILARAGGADSVLCGTGADDVAADVLDALDIACERVDYGPSGLVGPISTMTGGGRFVLVPGQGSARVDRRILADVLYFVRRYHVRVTAGYALSGHKSSGEHPLGLAVDLQPGPGGSWNAVDRLARWAEPRQNHPRLPFRWVGWNGDFNHGDPQHCRPSRGCPPHLHLSWSHSKGRPRHPVRTALVFAVR